MTKVLSLSKLTDYRSLTYGFVTLGTCGILFNIIFSVKFLFMNVSNVTDTVINTVVGTAAIVGAPPSIVDVETAKNGNLFINYAHGRYGGWRYTFRYQNSDFELIGYDLHYNRGPVPQYETSINFVTRKKLTRDNINKDDGGEDYEVLFEETWQDISIEELIRLSEVADFDDLDHVDFYSVP